MKNLRALLSRQRLLFTTSRHRRNSRKFSDCDTLEQRLLLAAAASSDDVTSTGATSHALSVAYETAQRLDPFLFDNDDVLVTGPNGYSEFATVDSVTPFAYVENILVEYSLVPPGGSWGGGDEGTYTISLRGNEVKDIYGEAFEPQTLGSFAVDFGGNVTRPGTFVLSSSTIQIAEDAGSAVVTVTRSNGSDGAVSVDYSTSTGSAGSSDFTAASGTLNFAAGETSQTISIPITDDSEEESEETFSVSISNPTGGAELGLTTEQTVSITDDDQPPPGDYPNSSASAPDVTQAGGVVYEFNVTYRSDSAVDPWTLDNRDVIVSGPNGYSELATAVISERHYVDTIVATYRVTPPGGDWDAADAGTYTVSQRARSVRDIYGDFVPEGTLDTFDVNFDGGQTSPGTIGLADATLTVYEFDGLVEFVVNRTGGSDGIVTVDYGTASSGTATANSDYTTASDTLTFADGQTTATITVDITDDNDDESDEIFSLVLANPTGGATLGTATSTVTIVDNDLPPSPGEINLTLSELMLHEDSNEGAVVTILRTGGSDGTVTVNYATSNGTATSGEDYTGTSGTLTFGDGETDRQVVISIANDSLIEDDETFSLTLSNPTGGATIGLAVQTFTIEDDDSHTHGPIFEEDFEGDTSGWQTNSAGSDTATTGQWEVGTPQQTLHSGNLLQRGDTTSGTQALVTGLSGGSSVGSFDIDNGFTTVLSPVINLPADSSVELSFNYVFAHLNNANDDDYLRVEVVGGSTSTAFSITGDGTTRPGVWESYVSGISAFAGQSIRLRITAADGGSGSLVEAAIDDVAINVVPNGPGEFYFDPDQVNVVEDVGVVTLNVLRTGNAGAVTVDFATSSDSATAGSDFTSSSGTVSFADGQSAATISVAVTDDNSTEGLETFHVELSNPTSGAAIDHHAEVTVNIVDNDAVATDYLPDLLPIISTSDTRYVDTDEQVGRALLRISTEVANGGDGPLEMWGGASQNNTQEVYQRIYQDGGYRDRLAGEFVYHPSHGHIHFEGFAEYNLRTINANNTLGPVVASGGKTSFCLVNIDQPLSDVTDAAAVVHGRGGNSCGDVQGISTGYSDVYGASLDDQWIDITNLNDGYYALEVIADPENRIQEIDESNNTGWIQIYVDNPYSSGGAAQPVGADLGSPVIPLSGANGDGVVVAVIDSGVDLQHPDLVHSIWTNTGEIDGDNQDNDGNGYIDDVHGFDFVQNDSGPFDENGHGTFIAGVIGAANNGVGSTGLAAGATLMPLRVLNEDNRGLGSDIAEAIRYAVNNGADIINLSLYADADAEIESAIQFAADHGVFVAVASGNDASDVPSYPATLSRYYSNVLSVGAWNGTDYVLGESNGVGDSGAVQIDAPGVQESTTPSGDYGSFLGTSVATANVSATAAMILQEHPGLNGSQIREIILATLNDPLPESDSLGTLNIVQAVGRAQLNELVQYEVVDNAITVTGTPLTDIMVIDPVALTLNINGVTWEIDPTATSILVDGAGGEDSFVVRATTGDDRVTLRPEAVTFAAPGLTIRSTDTENMTVHGNGGTDMAWLFDLPNKNDTFVGKPDFAAMTGVGYASVVREFANVVGYASSGTDHAQFYDSPGNETFIAKPEYATFTGDGFQHYTSNFDTKRAFATTGYDVARFYDSVNTDLYVAKPDYAYLSGPDYYAFGRNFDYTTAYSTRGGNDAAQFYDSELDDQFVGRAASAYMRGGDLAFQHVAVTFADVLAFAVAGGEDEVHFYDDAGSERVEAQKKRTALFSGTNFGIRTSQFERVRAFSTRGGTDIRDQDTGLDYFFESIGNWIDD